MHEEQSRDRVAALLQQRESLLADHKKLIRDCRSAMPVEATVWIEQHVARRSIEHSKLIEEIGQQRVREMRMRVDALRRRLPERVSEEFKRELDTGLDELKIDIGEIFRAVVSDLGAILNDYGLLVARPYFKADWASTAGGGFHYLLPIGPSQIGRELEAVRLQISEVDREIERIRNELNQAYESSAEE